MILREIQSYRVLDGTTNTVTPRPITYRLILPPLLYWRIELTERRLTLIEPQSGNLGSPEPNAFMVVVPPSYAAGQVFGIKLLDTDWESEGFAIGDVLDIAMGPLNANSVFLRATIQGISGQTAMLVIDNVYQVLGTLNTQNAFPLVAFLVNERFNTKAALLRDGDTGFISPLNGQPFYVSGHANSLIITQPSVSNTTLRYNLRLYNAAQEGNIDLYMPNARNLRSVYIEVEGTQFYAYRSSLDPTANTPTRAYPTRGKIVIDCEAPNQMRDLYFEAPCLLLHPNRIEETNSFVAPGTLTITSGASSISAPSIPSPIKQRVCLLGPDSHHSLPSISNSLELTAEVTPPSLPYISRAGADYVGVVVGQVSGRWVVVMTNRIPSTPPVYNLHIIDENLFPARYDCIVLRTNEPSARLTGIYTVIIYAKIAGNFVQIASYELNIRNIINTPRPDQPNGLEALGNLFPFERRLPSPYGVKVANYDTVLFYSDPIFGNETLFYVPIPSAQEAPDIGLLLTPLSGYLRDIIPFMDTPYTIKVQLLCPDGTLLETAPHVINYIPRPDQRYANITPTTNGAIITLNGFVPSNDIYEFQLRASLFTQPAGHNPIEQAMLYIKENYNSGSIITQYGQNSTRINITRTPLSGYSYRIDVSTDQLPPGSYVIHVRSEFSREVDIIGGHESFYYTLNVRSPEEPQGTPLRPIRCKTEIPAIYNEDWVYIVIKEDEVEYIQTNLDTCKLPDYCGCFTFVREIPEEWIDILGYFRGSIKGRPVVPNAKHKARFRGRIVRLDDEYTSEDFVSSLYRKEDIIRAYSERYQVEIFAHTPCDMTNLDILKLAERWDVINRSNRMLPDRIYNLRPAEISISDSGEHIKAIVTLKTLRWRDEYRRQG
jgi:hypothetical protein